MSTAQRVGISLLLIACSPLIMAAGGGPSPGKVSGVAFQDVNKNGIQDPDEPGLVGWTIHLFDTETRALVASFSTIAAQSTPFGATPDGSYDSIVLDFRNYTVCEALQEGWTQTAPLFAPPPPGTTLADCSTYTNDGTITPAPRGYAFNFTGFLTPENLDFGNFRGSGALQVGSIRGVVFDDLNGNGVRDPGEPGIPGWEVHLVVDGSATQPQPGPSVHASITVDRHTRRPPGGERGNTCFEPGCTTTTGGRASIILTDWTFLTDAAFNVAFPFQLGCVPHLPPRAEIVGESGSSYIPLSVYWLPPDLQVSLFGKLGVLVDPPVYVPVIKDGLLRNCAPDPNPANNQGVTNPGILQVEAEIGFVSSVNKVVVASTSTNASGEYEFPLPSGIYTVCGTLPPGWRQTFPGLGRGSVGCTGTRTGLGPHGHVVTLVDPSQVANADFGNTPFVSGLAALSDAQLWLGLKSSDDQGTRFDVKVELLKNGSPVASGLRRCVTGLTRNPKLAKGTRVAWDDLNPVPLAATDVLKLKISTRIGTNPDDTRCSPERGSSHTSARGLRLYYDSASQPSRFDATLTTDSNQARYLHSNGTACAAGGSESANVTDPTLPGTAPSAFAAAKCKDSSVIRFDGGNLFKEVGTWMLR